MKEADASRMMPLGRRLRATRVNKLPTPGKLTGLAQVSDRYGSRSVDTFRLDIGSLNHHTFLGDRYFFVTQSPSS